MRTFLKNVPVAGPVFKNLGDLFRQAKGRIASRNFYSKNKKSLLPNEALAGSAHGKRIFILATGPSIKTQDLSPLEGELCISVSNFFVHPDFNKIHPEYHIFAASHDPITDEQMVAWLRDAEKHFPDGQKVFLSDTDKYLVDKFNLLGKQRVFYYHLNFEKNIDIGKDLSFTGQLPKIITIAHTALYLAMYLGSKEICLLGVDHDWLLHIGESKHFYQEAKSELVNKGYVESVAKKETDLEKDFEASARLWRLYKKIRDYAKRRGIVIWNSTPNSLLDVFPRVPLKEISFKQ